MAAVRFAHVNLIARDYRVLAAFYCDLFGCVPVPPERDYRADWLARGTGVAGAQLAGVHLRLPGHDEPGGTAPTLEIFQYSELDERPPHAANSTGFGHIAFVVDDVADMVARVLARGGSVVGEPIEIAIAGAGTLLWQYVRDPEGNIIELQTWS